MFFGSQKDTIALIFDVGNGSLGGALVLMDAGQKPQLLYSMRDIFPFEEKPTAEKLELAVLKALENITSEIITKGFADPYFKKHGKKIDRIVCTLSSPWFASAGKTIVISESKKFIITERFLNDILAKELERFEGAMKESVAETGPKRVIEKDMASIKVNGYVLENPLGRKTDYLEISLYISEADEDFIKKISGIVSKHTHKGEESIVFHTFPFVAYSAISDMFVGTSEYLHFDVAGEITDITLVKDGMIQKTASYPTGTNLLLRQIAKRLSVPNQVARSLYHLFMDGRAAPDLQKEIQDALSEAESEWNVYLNDALVSLSGEASPSQQKKPEIPAVQVFGTESPAAQAPAPALNLPKKVYITAYPRTYELFNRFLQTEKTDETGEWRKGISTTYIGAELLGNYLISKPLQPFDAFLGLEALFLSKSMMNIK